eukprot:9212211-Pyramimonas_sp.AAC.1
MCIRDSVWGGHGDPRLVLEQAQTLVPQPLGEMKQHPVALSHARPCQSHGWPSLVGGPAVIWPRRCFTSVACTCTGDARHNSLRPMSTGGHHELPSEQWQ